MLFFTEIFQLLVNQTNLHYQQHLNRQAGPSRWLSDTLLDMMTFIDLALQMGHDSKHMLCGYRSRLRQHHTPFSSKTMTQVRFLHILYFMHFTDISQRPDQGKEYDLLWKLRNIFDLLNQTCTKFCNPLEHLAVDHVTVVLSSGSIFPRTGNILA